LEEGEVVKKIMRRLSFPNGSKQFVEDLLENIRSSELDNKSFCGKRELENAKSVIKENSDDSKIICELVEDG